MRCACVMTKILDLHERCTALVSRWMKRELLAANATDVDPERVYIIKK